MKLTASEYKLLREIQQNQKHKRNDVKVTVLLMLGFTHNTKSAYAWIEKGQEKEILYETLKDSKIKQVLLPPYSPNLNLIERL